ncbi:MAG: hypothetical protein PCFJNLEI_01540 [Verrucomicrobiae bacterium]|nr:hypothetical protein [Verrucomicrobiae bacterium]
MKIKKGDTVRIKTEWQDDGDDKIKFIAIEDEDGGRVRIEAQLDMPINPNQVVTTEMVEIYRRERT